MNYNKQFQKPENIVIYSQKRKNKNQNRFQNTLRKNQKIIDNYLGGQKRTCSKQGYYIIEKQKLQALKRKVNSPRYVIVNPNHRQIKRVMTQNKDYSDNQTEEQIQSLKSSYNILKNDISKSKYPYYLPVLPTHQLLSFRNPEISRITKKKNPSLYNHRYLSSSKIYYQNDLSQLQSKVDRLKMQIREQKLKNSYNLLNQIQIKKNPKYLPTIDVYNIDKSLNYDHGNSRIIVNQQYLSLNEILKKAQKKKIFCKWRKVVNSIRFVISLKRFSQKLRIKKQCYFKDSIQDNFYTQITLVKDHFLKATIQYCQSLPLNEPPNLLIVATDNPKQRQLKINLTRKYICLFLQKIGEMQFKTNIIKIITETCYYVCKHGSAGAISNYFSAEQLDLMSLNKQTMKIRAEKNLQKCQITTFIWIKLILFNIIFRSSKITELGLDVLWNSNFFLFGSLIYEISKLVHIQHMKKVPDVYEIGNWKYINFVNSQQKALDKNTLKKQIIPCKSMIITENPLQKIIKAQQLNSTQLIKGTVTKTYLSQAYEFENWQTEYRKIMNVTNFIHKKICHYHRELQKGLI